MLKNAQTVRDSQVIQKIFENRPVNEIRALGNEFKEQPGLVSMLATYDGKKLVLVVTCGPGSAVSAYEVLQRQLSAVNGRGGGDERIAQGGGVVTADQFSVFFENSEEVIFGNLPNQLI